VGSPDLTSRIPEDDKGINCLADPALIPSEQAMTFIQSLFQLPGFDNSNIGTLLQLNLILKATFSEDIRLYSSMIMCLSSGLS
jgi:hypothetical protein